MGKIKKKFNIDFFLKNKEFVMATCNRKKMLEVNKLETAFKMFDKDGSGALDIDELKEVFSGAAIPDDVWDEVIKEVDENKDGEVKINIFIALRSNFLNLNK